MVITTKPRGYVEVDHIPDESLYQADEMSHVLPIITIEFVEGLVDTSILQAIDDNDIQPSHDEDDENLNQSTSDNEEKDSNFDKMDDQSIYKLFLTLYQH